MFLVRPIERGPCVSIAANARLAGEWWVSEESGSRNAIAALVFTALFVFVAYMLAPAAFERLELAVYDLGARANQAAPSDRIVVVAVDEQSLAKLGPWPWPRNLHAELIDRLGAAGAALIVSTMFYPEAQQDRGVEAIDGIAGFLAQSKLMRDVPGRLSAFGNDLEKRARPDRPIINELNESWKQSALPQTLENELATLNAKIQDARGLLSAQDLLTASIANFGKVVLPMRMDLGNGRSGASPKPLPGYVQKSALPQVDAGSGLRGFRRMPLTAVGADVPPLSLREAARAVGNLSVQPDVDGVVRQEPLVVQHGAAFYPSLALAAAAQALGVSPDAIAVKLGEGITLGTTERRTSSSLQTRTHFYADRDGAPAFPVYSFAEVQSGAVAPERLRGKIVLTGATAPELADAMSTPVNDSLPRVLLLAHQLSSLLNGDDFHAPDWAPLLSGLALLVLAAYLALVVPRVRNATAATVSITLALLMLVAEYYALSASALWIPLVRPVVFLLLGHGFMLVWLRRREERRAYAQMVGHVDAARDEAAALQARGQLDEALDAYLQAPGADPALLEGMETLGLAFERKREFGKAEDVYRHIVSKQPGNAAVQDKLARLKRLSETLVLGAGTMSRNDGGGMTIVDATTLPKEMLGRYEIEHPLGKGAMGQVYLGRDPVIGRQVAIKTLALARDFDTDDLDAVKARFFREAESAGRLSHPHIVQIFDVGEDRDLAYIAMEFVQGHDLSRCTKPNSLLPVTDVITYIADAADALDYAHQHGVVHRDIKPANLMLITDSRTVKVTDFGIARITDSSKTRTGIVLGSPSYMSPEQLAGRKVDGRSDLFSLGVTLYQLLCGTLPFQADSLAALMIRIVHEPHAPLTTLRPDLPPAINAAVNKALQKNLEQRYARASDFAAALRELLNVPA
jgi:serine/threonine-protein kinase